MPGNCLTVVAAAVLIRHHPTKQVRSLRPQVAFVVTTSESLTQIKIWLAYHRAIGVSMFYIFVDGQVGGPWLHHILPACAPRFLGQQAERAALCGARAAQPKVVQHREGCTGGSRLQPRACLACTLQAARPDVVAELQQLEGVRAVPRDDRLKKLHAGSRWALDALGAASGVGGVIRRHQGQQGEGRCQRTAQRLRSS